MTPKFLNLYRILTCIMCIEVTVAVCSFARLFAMSNQLKVETMPKDITSKLVDLSS